MGRGWQRTVGKAITGTKQMKSVNTTHHTHGHTRFKPLPDLKRINKPFFNWSITAIQCCVTGEGKAPHSSTLAWKIPWVEEPGRLQSTGSLRVGHDWATSISLFTFMHWRRKWQPTPGFLPGQSQRRGSLVGCRLWGRTESDTTEVT